MTMLATASGCRHSEAIDSDDSRRRVVDFCTPLAGVLMTSVRIRACSRHG
jgi:hypothetical protein